MAGLYIDSFLDYTKLLGYICIIRYNKELTIMDFILFLIFGMLETYAIFALVFVSFWLPYREYLGEITVMALLVTLLSYLLRNVLDLNMVVDVGAAYIMMILFLRFLIRLKLFRAIMISLTYFAYAIINSFAFFLLSSTGLVDGDMVINNAASPSAFLVQGASAAIAVIVAYLVHRTKIGYSFIIRPPHDFFVRTHLKRSEVRIILSVGASFIAFLVTVGLITEEQTFMGLPLVILLFVTLLILAYRRDMSHE